MENGVGPLLFVKNVELFVWNISLNRLVICDTDACFPALIRRSTDAQQAIWILKILQSQLLCIVIRMFYMAWQNDESPIFKKWRFSIISGIIILSENKGKESGVMPRSAKDIQLMELKDTVSQLNELLRNQTKAMDSLRKTIEKLQLDLENKTAEIEYLKGKLFGSSSERRTLPYPGQMGLLETDDRIPEIIEPEEIQVSAHKRARKAKATYEEQFDRLPVRQVPLDTVRDEKKVCPVCGTEMVPIGTEVVRTELVYHPAVLEKVEYTATTYSCPSCKDTLEPQFVKDEANPLVPHSYVSSGLAAHVMYAKFINAMPYYRQEKDFEEQFGVKISRGTMAHWTVYCSQNYFMPMIDYFHRLLVKRRFVGADETPIQVLKEEGRRPQAKSYVWLFRSGDDGKPPIILYEYHPTRNGDAAAEFFHGSEAGTYIIVDGYAGYNKLKEFKRCSCYAHIRRYFLEAIPKGKEKDITEPAVQGFLYCNKLFEYERNYREKELTYKQRYNRRQRDEQPIVEAFMAWIDKQAPTKGSRLARAITYAYNQKPYMKTYLEDGHCSLSNNMSENSIRPVTVGRRNWLFCDTTEGADASMVLYSLLETARSNGLNPQKYLQYLLDVRPNVSMSDKELERFAPWNDQVQEQCMNKS